MTFRDDFLAAATSLPKPLRYSGTGGFDLMGDEHRSGRLSERVSTEKQVFRLFIRGFA